MPIHEGLRGLSRFILFQLAFIKSHRLRKSGRQALLYHKLSYVVCTVFTHYTAKKDKKVWKVLVCHSLYKAIYFTSLSDNVHNMRYIAIY